MDDQLPQQPVGGVSLPPPSLTPTQEELCEKLDELHTMHGLKTKPSDMFRGAIFASKPELRNNPDWMAQAANSLRDILYPFGGDTGAPKKEVALKQFGSVRTDPKFTQEVGKMLGALTEIAHHGNGRGSSVDYQKLKASEFEGLLANFESVMLQALTRQLDVHAEIDDIFASESPTAEVAQSSAIQHE